MRSCLLLCVASLLMSGCLKTRAQLRKDDPYKPVKVTRAQKVQGGGYAVEEIKSEITHLTGRIEDLERADRARDQDAIQKKDVAKLEDRIKELEEAQLQLLSEFKKFRASIPPPDPVRFFQAGKREYEEGRHAKAIGQFDRYLSSKNGKHRREATFLRGESYFAIKEYKKAIVDYSKFPEKYTKSRYMSKALYQIARSFERLGMKSDARAFYQELADSYPKTAEGRKAVRIVVKKKKKPKKRQKKKATKKKSKKKSSVSRKHGDRAV